MNRGVRSSPELDDKIVRSYDELKNIYLVAKRFQCSHTHVIRVLRRNEIPRGPKGKPAKILDDIAALPIGGAIFVDRSIAGSLYHRMKLRGIGIRICGTTCWRIS